MSTPYSDIFTKANILFEDASLLANLTDDEYTELLEIFLSKGKTLYFKSCKKDLTDINDTTKVFNETLDDEEQWILAQSIFLVWLEKQLYKEEKLRDRITTKDYNSFSKANLIDKLTILKNDALKQLKSLVIDYTFNSFEGFN
ncbi:MAG: hypothetical protein PHT02_00165 [Tissierellia bacterium]|nr:hypothetical protein [Tissierellia bacterium]